MHDRGSFITVTSTYLSHCHTANEIQAMELSASVPLSTQLKGKGIPKPIHVLLSTTEVSISSCNLPVGGGGEDKMSLGPRSMQTASGVSVQEKTAQRNKAMEKRSLNILLYNSGGAKSQYLEFIFGNEEMPFPFTKQQ